MCVVRVYVQVCLHVCASVCADLSPWVAQRAQQCRQTEICQIPIFCLTPTPYPYPLVLRIHITLRAIPIHVLIKG